MKRTGGATVASLVARDLATSDAPELFDKQDCFATEWESFQIEPEGVAGQRCHR
jgi:hypothetical protein